jgi:hypothetical protein
VNQFEGEGWDFLERIELRPGFSSLEQKLRVALIRQGLAKKIRD